MIKLVIIVVIITNFIIFVKINNLNIKSNKNE